MKKKTPGKIIGKVWHAYTGAGVVATVATSKKGWSVTVGGQVVADYILLGPAIADARLRTEPDYCADDAFKF